MANQKKLSDFKVLTFDCYGTIIDWETGVVNALEPILEANNAAGSFTRAQLLEAYQACEGAQQTKTPDMPYDQVLTTIHPHVAARLGLATATPTPEQDAAFGASVGSWPAFPDSVDALKRLSKFFKLVILSNVDRASFSRTNSGPLQAHPFDAILTAQDIGSYKPDLRNFEYMLKEMQSRFGAAKEEVLQTAQSQFHDHAPAKKVGMSSVWIARPGAIMGNVDAADEIWDWKFDTLGQMADAVEAEGVAA